MEFKTYRKTEAEQTYRQMDRETGRQIEGWMGGWVEHHTRTDRQTHTKWCLQIEMEVKMIGCRRLMIREHTAVIR